MNNRFLIIKNSQSSEFIFSEFQVGGNQTCAIMFANSIFPGLDVASVKRITYGSKRKDDSIIWKLVTNKMPIQQLFQEHLGENI
jgi:hypothetical protein